MRQINALEKADPRNPFGNLVIFTGFFGLFGDFHQSLPGSGEILQ
jgi:hypothetical protein